MFQLFYFLFQLIFFLYLSLFLMFEFDNFLDGVFPYLLNLFVGLSKWKFSCVFGLLLRLVLLVLLSLLVRDSLDRNISAQVAFFRSSFSTVIFVALTAGLGVDLKLLYFLHTLLTFLSIDSI